MEDDDVFHAVDALPDVVRHDILMGQVAIDTPDRTMRALVEP